ncbi:N-acetyl sugar amidotransferase [Gammaproteobacteria bacterium]|nr:N-acetyl sugar amidotransferase [Gammaproteobacteria bacterium]
MICKNCVMDTTDPRITFDENGVCDNCINYQKNVLPFYLSNIKNNTFGPIANKIAKEGRGKEFDCILGMSGGLDSSFLLHKVVTEYNLRPLVFHVDAGWNSDIAVNNIKNLTAGLNLDLYTEVIDWPEIRSLQTAFFKSGVPHIDVPQDHAFISVLYHYASKYKIKYILNGGNFSTEGIRNPLSWLYFGSDKKQLLDINAKFGSKKLEHYPVTNVLWHKFYLPYVKGIKVIKPLNFIEYKKRDAEKELSEVYGWKSYPQKHFESRFTRFFEGFWLIERFGYDTRKPQFSSLIVSGQMTRDEALHKLQSKPLSEEIVRQEFEYVADKLNISLDELQACLVAPHKDYRDFKSMDWIYNFGSSVMRKLGLERSSKR